MISVDVDMRLASQTEREAFFALPHVGGAIDTMAMLGGDTLRLSLHDGQPAQQAVASDQLEKPVNTQPSGW